jgi:hypothetical protein
MIGQVVHPRVQTSTRAAPIAGCADRGARRSWGAVIVAAPIVGRADRGPRRSRAAPIAHM